MAFTLNMTLAADVDDSILQEFDQQFLVAAGQENVMDQFVSYKKQIGAESIKLPKYSRLAIDTTPLDEDDDVTSEKLADVPILLTPKEYGKVVTTTTLAELQSGGTAGRAASRLVGMNMGQVTDRLACEAADASANVSSVDGVAEGALTAGNVFTVSYLNDLYNKLARRSVKPLSDGMYVFAAHEDVIADLRDEAGQNSWTDISKHQRSESVLKNEIGQLAGFKIVRDNLATLTPDASGTVDSYRSYAMGFNALGKAASAEPAGVITGPYDKLSRFLNVGWKGCLEYKIIDQDALELAISASSKGDNA